MIPAESTVLFQGDSITDAGRARDQFDSLGQGYAMIAAAWYNATYPEHKVRFLNRGISGNRSCDLVTRWDADCIALKPDIVSIMIGINDTWRGVDSNMPTTAEQFKSNYRAILQATTERLAARIIILEPFLLVNQPNYAAMRADLNAKIDAIMSLTNEFNVTYIALDGIFQGACGRAPATHWSGDGVHLTAAGNALVAQTWLQCI